MKKFFAAWLVSGLFLIVSCETASTAKEAEQDAIEATDTVIKDATAKVDTTLSSLGDSLKADIDSATHKIKERTRALGDAAKQKANEGVEKLKEGAQKIKDAAKAGVDAAKDELKK